MKIYQKLIVTSVLVMSPLVLRAQSTTNTTTAQDVKDATKNAFVTTGHYTKEQLQELDKKSEAEFHALGKKLDDLKTKAQSQTGQAKADLDKKVDEAQKKLDELKPKLKELKTATTNAWNDVKSSFDKGIDDLKNMLP
jgi:predicted nuclease with TOPRIM domain